MGEIQRDRRGRFTFIYDNHWRSMDAAYPLSLTMPLVVGEHGHAKIEPWLLATRADMAVPAVICVGCDGEAAQS